jgi:hypothetical protein
VQRWKSGSSLSTLVSKSIGGEMQDEIVGWDPIAINYTAPWETRLLLLYLLVALVFTAVRTISLARQLGWFAVGRWEPQSILSHGPQDMLASAALRDQFPPLLTNKTFAAIVAGGKTLNGPASLIQSTDVRFQYLWETCFTSVRSLRKLAVGTFLLSVFVLIIGLANGLRKTSVQKLSWVGTVFPGVVSASFVAFAIGILVCVMHYAAYSFCETALMRRRAAWKYFTDCNKNQFVEIERTQADRGS